MADVNRKRVGKITVREELEQWNVIYVMKRLNAYYRTRLGTHNLKQRQGFEASDFSMNVISKIVSEERSWQKSNYTSFMDFVYGVAKSEFSTWLKSNKSHKFIPYEINQENKSNLHIRENYNGF